MTRGLLLANGIALATGAAGIAMLARPAAAVRLLGLAASEQARYGLRIAGAMLFAAALFLAGFATAFSLASAA